MPGAGQAPDSPGPSSPGTIGTRLSTQHAFRGEAFLGHDCSASCVEFGDSHLFLYCLPTIAGAATIIGLGNKVVQACPEPSICDPEYFQSARPAS